MPILATIMASAGGGRFTPDKPEASHTAAGQFTISNWDGTFIYTLTTGSRVDAVITLSSTTQTSDVTAKAPKGVSVSATMSVARQPLTYPLTCTSIYFACVSSCGSMGGCTCGGTCGCACTYYPSGECAGLFGYQICSCTCPLDTTPASQGYVQAHGEWGRVL